MTQISKRSSFSLVRTNPRLTTNVKIVCSNDKVYLDSIEADPILAKSLYKKFDVTGGNFSYDLYNFFNQGGKLPQNLAYKPFEKYSYDNVKSSFSEQYDFEYCSGAYTKNSALYDEEFALFAPLWIEKDAIPEYFVILKLDEPVTKTSKYSTDLDSLDADITNPLNFFDHYIKKSKMVKTISLKAGTAIGNYIREHVNDSSFPEGSVYASIKKDELSYINGISYHSGGFCQVSHNFYEELVLTDKTITEKDNILTNKFMDLGVVHPNILNLEFLFDDDDQYKINRYMGFYVSECQLTEFSTTDEFKNSTVANNTIKVSQFSSNAKDITIESFYNRIPYIKDAFDNIYLIDQDKDFQKQNVEIENVIYPVPLELIVKDEYLDHTKFSNYEPVRTIDVLKTDKSGRSSFVFRVNGSVPEDTQIRIGKTDLVIGYNDPDFDYFGVRGSSELEQGLAHNILFSVNGNTSDIAKAIASAINNIEILAGEQIFSAISQNDLVIVYIKIKTSFWDNLKWSIFSISEEFPFTIINGNDIVVEDVTDYILTYNSFKNTLPLVDDTFLLRGKLVKSTFKGGSDTSFNRLIINANKASDFYELSNSPLFVKTESSYSKISSISSYLDEPLYDQDGNISSFNNVDMWSVVLLSPDHKVSFNNKVILYKEKLPLMGYLSIFPIKDFDFDTYNMDYVKCEDEKISQLWNYYLSNLGDYDINGYAPEETQYDNFYKLNTILGIFSNEFLSSKGYTKLSEVNLNEDYDYLKELAITNGPLTSNTIDELNEYDRLNEKYLTPFATFSKVVPFVNKWVGDDFSTDVRNNNYRLNADQAFGHLNFSPSFDYFNRDPRYFTHEWYLLQKYPPYLTEEDKINSYSYFESNIDESMLKSVNEDYFNSYFTRRFVGQKPIKTDYKYSLFSGGTTQRFAECIFRGVKVRIKKRVEQSEINYNLKDKKFITDGIYNGWKFAAVLALNNQNEVGTSIKFIKNAKFKNVTCLVKADLADVIQTDFIDRTLLYTLNHRVVLNGRINFANKSIPGQIYAAQKNTQGNFVVTAKNINSRNFPNFKNDIILNSSNSYNDIIFSDSNISIRFGGISSIVDSGTFICSSITATYNSVDYILDSFHIENNILYEDAYLDIPGLPNSTVMNHFMGCIKNTDMLYEGGGYNGYYSTIKEISFANLANMINLGDPKISYVKIDESGNEVLGDFVIELVRPDAELVSTYLESTPILPNKDIEDLNSFNIFGYNLGFKDRTEIKTIFRNQFYFNPKVYDVVNFCDDSNVDKLVLKNTKFYVTSDSFNIKNLFYNKVNTQNSENVLKLTGVNQYPLINQCTISKKNFNVFKSNWDTNYYDEFITEKKSNSIIGTSEQYEQRSFFGSKLMLLPDNVQISYISQSPINLSTVAIEDLNETSGGILYENTTNSLKINVLTSILLQNYFLGEELFVKQFSDYINENYSFGQSNLEDDIRRYVKLNVEQRYIIKDIVLWKKSLTYVDKNLPLFRLDLTESQKTQNSFYVVTNFINEKMGPYNNLITYNKKLDETEQFSITVNLKKI